MRQENFRSTLFLTTALLASTVFIGPAFAQNGETSNDAEVKTVSKCVSADGHITLTDAACPQDSAVAKVDPSPARAPVTEHYKLPASEVHRKAWAAAPLPRKPSPDVATLRAARETMLMAQSTHQQRLAGLD